MVSVRAMRSLSSSRRAACSARSRDSSSPGRVAGSRPERKCGISASAGSTAMTGCALEALEALDAGAAACCACGGWAVNAATSGSSSAMIGGAATAGASASRAGASLDGVDVWASAMLGAGGAVAGSATTAGAAGAGAGDGGVGAAGGGADGDGDSAVVAGDGGSVCACCGIVAGASGDGGSTASGGGAVRRWAGRDSIDAVGDDRLRGDAADVVSSTPAGANSTCRSGTSPRRSLHGKAKPGRPSASLPKVRLNTRA